jgi:hypothetical protein
MEQLKQSVATARRRLILQQFVGILPWCLFGSLLLAVIGLAVPKVWFLGFDPSVWLWSWLGGAIGLGFVAAVITASIGRLGTLDAAIEVDRRCGLKERVSSALALSPDELDSDVGQALLEDTSRRVEQVSVNDEFRISTDRRALLPLLPAIVLGLLAWLPDAAQDKAQASNSQQMKEQIRRTTEELQKRLAKRRERSQQAGLKDAEELYKKLLQGIDDLKNDSDVDRKKALVKMNDLAKEIEKRRNVLGDSEKMKQQFSRLKNIARGPAKKMAGALQQGDFQKALEALKQLSEKIKNGELAKEDEEKLASQMNEMKQKLQQMVEDHEQAKEDLKRKIAQKEAAGDLEAAGRLQRQFDQLEKMDRQMERLSRMAQQMEMAQEKMAAGDPSAAMEQLERMASELQDMQEDMDQLQSLDELMDEIAAAKDAMADQGDADAYASLMGDLDQFSSEPGDGMGQNAGYGYRPEQETETGEYQARERAKPRPGEAVRVGDAFGPNRAGMSNEEIKQQILGSLKGETDPLTDQRLPKSQQDHVRQYYRRLTEGQSPPGG